MTTFTAEKNGKLYVGQHKDLRFVHDIGTEDGYFLEEVILDNRKLLIEFEGKNKTADERLKNLANAISERGFTFIEPGITAKSMAQLDAQRAGNPVMRFTDIAAIEDPEFGNPALAFNIEKDGRGSAMLLSISNYGAIPLIELGKKYNVELRITEVGGADDDDIERPY